MRFQWGLISITALLFLSFSGRPSFARVGGGHSYSGRGTTRSHPSSGNSQRSGGWGDGGGGSHSGSYRSYSNSYPRPYMSYGYVSASSSWLITFLFLAILIGIILVIYRNRRGGVAPEEAQPEGESGQFEDYLDQAHQVSVNSRLKELRTRFDPSFSRVLFMDFFYGLFSKVQMARGNGQLNQLSGYLSEEAIQAMKNLSPKLSHVEGVVIGSAAILSVSPLEEDTIYFTLQLEANYTETDRAGQTQSWYTQESWTLKRKRSVKSKAPDRIHVVACPACGAPPSNLDNGVCRACGNRNDGGDFDWLVEVIAVQREKRPPLLTSTVEETGTDLETIVDPDLVTESQALATENPKFSWSSFTTRAQFAFLELQKAWTERKWEKCRPFESDNMFQSHFYWMSEYKRQHLINVLKDVRIQKIEPVKVLRDQYYTSITVRIFASMIDFTQSETGALVAGNARSAREFSEYWTFIQGHSAKAGKTADNDHCPACGAALKINMAGVCEYCQAKVTAGDFDWVLSQIEQDEAYLG